MLTGDAGNTTSYAGWVPADLVLMCGVFGNISDEDVELVVKTLPALCASGGTVIWTRHRRAPDLTVRIRAWLEVEEFQEVGFHSPGSESFAVGVHRYIGRGSALAADARMFTFVR